MCQVALNVTSFLGPVKRKETNYLSTEIVLASTWRTTFAISLIHLLTFVVKSLATLAPCILDDPFGDIRPRISIGCLNVHFLGHDIPLSRLVYNADGIDSNRLIELISNEIFTWSSTVPSIGKPISAAPVVESTAGLISKVA